MPLRVTFDTNVLDLACRPERFPKDLRQPSMKNVETIALELSVEQPGRKPLHPEVVARMKAAKASGVRVLQDVPRIGALRINDPTGESSLSRGEGDELGNWINKAHEVARRSKPVGLGYAPGEGARRRDGRLRPTLPTWAVRQVGSYLRYTGRAANTVAKAAGDPQETLPRFEFD